MAFPKKFKHLLELELEDAAQPDQAWLTYAVCACTKDACTWQGWIIESVSREGKQLWADTYQKCPECGRDLFRTGATVKFRPSEDQTPKLRPGIDYETVPIEYDDD